MRDPYKNIEMHIDSLPGGMAYEMGYEAACRSAIVKLRAMPRHPDIPVHAWLDVREEVENILLSSHTDFDKEDET